MYVIVCVWSWVQNDLKSKKREKKKEWKLKDWTSESTNERMSE